MNFRPSDPDRVLHDTWVFLADEDIHLFYLAPQVGNSNHRLIGHAVSNDWLHWRELPYIELTGAPGSWDAGRVGTGHVFKHDDGRYYMAYTGRVDPREEIGLAVSDDLITWHKPLDEPVLPQRREPPYEHSLPEHGNQPAWRDPFVIRTPDGTLHAYFTARVDRGASSGRGCVGRARIDAPDRWTLLEPIAATGDYAVMEVPEIFEFEGRWWLTFNTGSGWGCRLDTQSRRLISGTFCLSAEEIEEPWTAPRNNLLIGSGEGRRDAIVARSVEYQGERLVYHHYDGDLTAASPRALGLPKVLACSGDGLALRPWPGISRIWREEISLAEPQPLTAQPWARATWDIAPPRILGQCAESVAACRAELPGPDLDLELDIQIDRGERAGITLGAGDGSARGVCILLDNLRNELSIGYMRPVTYGIILDATMDRCLREIRTDVKYSLRIIKRDRYVEVFVERELLFSLVVETSEEGRSWLGMLLDRCNARFHLRRVTSLEPIGDTS